MTVSPTTGVEINLTGTISEWDHAFGVDWLNIETLRLQLGLKAVAAVALGSSADARLVLFKDTGTSAEQFDRELLVAWLNVANGALPLTTPLDFNRDGQLDGTVAQLIANAEHTRLNPASTKAQIDAARKTLSDLQKIAC